MWDDAHNDGTIGDSTSVLYLILSRNRAGTAYVTDAVCVCVCNIQIIIHSVTVWTAGLANISAYQVCFEREVTSMAYLCTQNDEFKHFIRW